MSVYHAGKVLTPRAEADRAEFEREYGSGNCSCHISSPCSSCTHPGNPANQADDDSCWMAAVTLPPPAMIAASTPLESILAMTEDRPRWKGLPMKEGYCICRDCQWPIRLVNRVNGGKCFAHVSALPRCTANPVHPMRQTELLKLLGGDHITEEGGFAWAYSAERNVPLAFIDLPACEACDEGEDVFTAKAPHAAPLHRDVPPDFGRMALEAPRYSLWKFFADQHGLHLLESEFDEIVLEVERYRRAVPDVPAPEQRLSRIFLAGFTVGCITCATLVGAILAFLYFWR